MGMWGRVMNAIKAGITAYREERLIPDEFYDWDDYESRLFRYHFYSAYYNNIAYRDISRFAPTYKRQHALYKHMRGVYNPVARLVDLYVAKCYGGSLDYEALEDGAVPIMQADDRLREAIRQVWLWSNWGNAKSLYVRLGAQFGDVGLWVVDDRQRERVRLEVVHPGKIRECEFDEVGNVRRVRFEYARVDPMHNGGQEYTFAMDVTKDEYVTFLNGAEYAYYDDGTGNATSRWRNDYGFVPLVLAQHKDLGMAWGGAVFHASVGKIDELNDAASLLNDSVRKSVQQMWFMAGVRGATDLQIPGTIGDGTSATDASSRRDQIPMLYAPNADARPISMAPNVDIASGLSNLNAMLLEIERDMPELSLHRLREGGQLTAPGVRAAYSDAIDKIIEARGNYDDALVRAQKMAITMGGVRGYAPMRGYTLDSYARGDLDHYIAERAVIEDALTKQERLNVLLSLPERTEQARLILEELEYDDERIETVLAEMEEGAERETRNAVRGMAEAWFGPRPVDEELDIDEAEIDEQTPPTPDAAAA